MSEPRATSAGMKQFAGFVIVGGVAAVANVGARILLSEVMRFEAAVVVAYCIGVMVAFVLNRRFVFPESSSPHGKALGRFIGVNVIALAQVYAVSVLLARLVFPAIGFGFYPETIAHILGVASPVLTSFLLHKNYTFAS
ncbi:MAG TPA: GtrA family protein [Bauldia sp.]|nr:GtrA family protein [Bauldia sp.]